MVSSSNRPPTTRGQRVDQHKSHRLPATASVNPYGIREAVVGSPSINAMKSASEKTNLLTYRLAHPIRNPSMSGSVIEPQALSHPVRWASSLAAWASFLVMLAGGLPRWRTRCSAYSCRSADGGGGASFGACQAGGRSPITKYTRLSAYSAVRAGPSRCGSRCLCWTYQAMKRDAPSRVSSARSSSPCWVQ